MLAGSAGNAMPFAVKNISVATAEDGKNLFRVEAQLAAGCRANSPRDAALLASGRGAARRGMRRCSLGDAARRPDHSGSRDPAACEAPIVSIAH